MASRLLRDRAQRGGLMLTKTLSGVATALLILGLGSGVAWADGGTGTCGTTTCWVDAGGSGGGGSSGGGGGGGNNAGAGGNDNPFILGAGTGAPCPASPTDPVAVAFCAGQNQPAPPPPSAYQVAQMASARIRLDNPRIGSAPCTTAGCMGAVGVPVWLWVDDGFPTRTATASVQGVSVTVTARMERVDWSMGDGHTVTCHTGGTPYTIGLGWRESPDCGYLYQQTSREQPNGTYTLRATAHWTIVFTGDYRATMNRTTTSAVQVKIGEYQVVITG